MTSEIYSNDTTFIKALTNNKQEKREMCPQTTVSATSSSTQDTIVLTIEGVSHDGRGVARRDGDKLVVFVAGAVPGQTIRARITDAKKNLASAVCEEILSEEGLRDPLCQCSNQCGGCSLQRLPDKTQHYWKHEIIRQALRKIARMPDAEIQDVLSPLHFPENSQSREQGYRNKIEYAFGRDRDTRQICLGFRPQGSHQVIEPVGCILMPEEAEKIRRIVLECVQNHGLQACGEGRAKEGCVRHLIVRYSMPKENDSGNENKRFWWLVLSTNPCTATEKKKITAAIEDIFSLCPAVYGVVHEEQKQHGGGWGGSTKRVGVFTRNPQTENREATLHLPLGGKMFQLDVGSFFQVNLNAAEILVEKAKRLAEPYTDTECFLDLYCGVGAPGLLLSARAKKTLAAEANARSVTYAKRNAQGFKQSAYTCLAGICEQILPSLLSHTKKGGFALVDPPRAGLTEKLCGQLCSLKASALLYLSCNPATLARDLSFLRAAYTVQNIIPVDLFPHTPHVESCTLLTPTLGA